MNADIRVPTPLDLDSAAYTSTPFCFYGINGVGYAGWSYFATKKAARRVAAKQGVSEVFEINRNTGEWKIAK